MARTHVSLRWTLPPLAAVLCLAAISLGCGSDDPTGTDSGSCELVFILGGNDPNPDTRLQVVNALSGGLQAIVGHQRFADTGADMAPGECVAWGVFADVFQVRLQQCNQANPGSTECTSTFGPEVIRDVTVADGDVVTLRVTPAFFQ